MSSCSACPRTAPDGHHLCPLCTDDIRGWLTELPAQARLLADEFLTPGAAPRQGRIGGTGRAHSPVPVDLRVLNLLLPGRYDPVPGTDDDGEAPIAATLAAWAGHIAYTYPSVHRDRHGTAHARPCEQARPAGGTGLGAWCAWLTAYLPYIATIPAAAEFHEQLGDLVHRVRGLTHTEPRTHPRDAPCPACQAYRLVSVDGQDHITCKACGHRLTPAEYDQHTAAFLDSLDKDQQPA